jgi:iron complex outermembrane receptor protein/vitamin B12 transporter
VCLLIVSAARVGAQESGTITGMALDQLGAPLSGATVTLSGGPTSRETMTGGDGSYSFTGVAAGRYQVVATASGFSPATSEPVYVGAGARVTVDVTLQVGPLQQAVVVTAAASEMLQSQTGAPVTVIDSTVIAVQNKPDLQEALRLVPGAQVQQTGARGGQSSLFVRGGASNFTKVLVDGVAINDIGGGFDFSQLQTTGVDRIEVLRQPNSVIYGSDALTGVVNIETRRGRTRVPDVAYTIDGGNLGTFRTNASIGGAAKRVDYFSEYSYFTTDNKVPNNGYRNRTYAGRFGVMLGNNTDLNATLRHIDGESGSPNGFGLYLIADDSTSNADLLYGGIRAQSQWTDRLQTTIRYGSMGQTSLSTNPTPTGQPFDPTGFGANYLGRTVTLRGANDTSVTGQAILDYGGSYPQSFESRTTRRTVFGQSTYRVTGDLHISGGGRFEREAGYSDPDGDPNQTRNNGGVFVEGRGSIGGRTHISAGIGVEHNAAFETAATPRLSIATYFRNPTQSGVGDTKLVLNFGKGIKAMSVFQQQSSLFGLLDGAPNAPPVEPLGPERSTSFDVGMEQGFADGRVRARASYFRNSFEDLIEFVNKSALPLVGVPPEVAQATQIGAYVNSSSYDSQGLETSAEAALGPVRLMAAYTFVDAEVTESFTGGVLAPAFNPAFPGVAIGQFSPLVGERPFRSPTHSGSFMVSYGDGPLDVALSAYLTGRRDGSTFLSDGFFGYSMLLPNQDLEAGYQKVDLAAGYLVHRSAKVFASIENLFDEDYQASYGFPALPITARVGVTLRVGGR